MSIIKTIYINQDKSWFETKPYNGSWHPIIMDTVDGLDYSIQVYDTWYEFLEMMEEENEVLTEQELKQYFTEFIYIMEDCGWGVEVLK
jgi:hypothetical protein